MRLDANKIFVFICNHGVKGFFSLWQNVCVHSLLLCPFSALSGLQQMLKLLTSYHSYTESEQQLL